MNSKISASRLKNSVILVVEDLELSRRLIGSTLESAGYTHVIFAANGEEAIAKTHEYTPDIIILDLMMPVMDGYEYCEKIRADTKFDRTPILVQTALDSAEQKLRAFKVGASDYICKPIIPGELLARTSLHLSTKLLLEDLENFHHQTTEELKSARNMQMRIMPGTQQISLCERVYDMNIAQHFETSSTLGGDCWGMRALSDQRLAIYMFDFSGHGICAAMNVFRLHSMMQELIFNHTDPGEFLTRLSKLIEPLLAPHEFATMFYGIIDIEANCLLYATAASPTLMLYSALENKTLPLSGRGFPLGVKNITYDTQYAPFCKGDLLLLFSDCLIETNDTNGQVISDDHIANLIHKAMQTPSDNPANQTINNLLQHFQSHSQAPINDDLTINVYYRK